MAFDFNKVKAYDIQNDYSLIDNIRDKIDNVFDFDDKKIWAEPEFIIRLKERINFSENEKIKSLGPVITFDITNGIYDEQIDYMKFAPGACDVVRDSSKIKKILIAIYKNHLNHNSWMPNKVFIEILNKKDNSDQLYTVNQGLHKINIFGEYQLGEKPLIDWTIDTSDDSDNSDSSPILTSFDFNIKELVDYMIFVNNIIYTKIDSNNQTQITKLKKGTFEIEQPSVFYASKIKFTENGAQNFIDFLKWGITQGAFNISISSYLIFQLIDALPKIIEFGESKTLKNLLLINIKETLYKSYDEIQNNNLMIPFNTIIKPTIKFLEDLKINKK
jgi:hypothetical protein